MEGVYQASRRVRNLPAGLSGVLGLTPQTVRTYIRNLKRKLGVRHLADISAQVLSVPNLRLGD